jgi:outer membrane receptor for monomeric catechols
VQNEDGFWRIRMNHDLNDLIKNADIVRYVKSKRMAWLGHVMRMEGEIIPKRVLEWKPMGRRTQEDQGKDGLRTLKKIYR